MESLTESKGEIEIYDNLFTSWKMRGSQPKVQDHRCKVWKIREFFILNKWAPGWTLNQPQLLPLAQFYELPDIFDPLVIPGEITIAIATMKINMGVL